MVSVSCPVVRPCLHSISISLNRSPTLQSFHLPPSSSSSLSVSVFRSLPLTLSPSLTSARALPLSLLLSLLSLSLCLSLSLLYLSFFRSLSLPLSLPPSLLPSLVRHSLTQVESRVTGYAPRRSSKTMANKGQWTFIAATWDFPVYAMFSSLGLQLAPRGTVGPKRGIISLGAHRYTKPSTEIWNPYIPQRVQLPSI